MIYELSRSDENSLERKKKKILEPLWPDLLLEIQVHDDVV